MCTVQGFSVKQLSVLCSVFWMGVGGGGERRRWAGDREAAVGYMTVVNDSNCSHIYIVFINFIANPRLGMKFPDLSPPWQFNIDTGALEIITVL